MVTVSRPGVDLRVYRSLLGAEMTAGPEKAASRRNSQRPPKQRDPLALVSLLETVARSLLAFLKALRRTHRPEACVLRLPN